MSAVSADGSHHVVKEQPRRNFIAASLLLLLLSCPFYTNFFLSSYANAPKQLALHQEVLAGRAGPPPLQYQLYVHDHLLEMLFQLMPSQSDGWFALTYSLYYGAGLVIFLLLLFRLCARLTDTGPALAACFYLIAILPIFWHDNWYHPQDPWGALLGLLLVDCLLKDYRDWRYFGLLLLSGFAWEKHFLLPFSVAAADWLQGRRSRKTIVIQLGLALIFAAIGQIIPRLIYEKPIWRFDVPFASNLNDLDLYVWGIAVVFGVQLLYVFQRPRKIPLVLIALLAQLPVWLAIYLAFRGVLKEMRGILIVVPYTWPILAMALQEWVMPATRAPAAQAVER